MTVVPLHYSMIRDNSRQQCMSVDVFNSKTLSFYCLLVCHVFAGSVAMQNESNAVLWVSSVVGTWNLLWPD